MPLLSLIPSLLRVNVASSSTGPHPLLSHLERILLSGRVASDKYREQLPQVISDGGGAGELEEMVMWYALSYEKNDQLESQSKPGSPERMEELAADQKWLSTWFERMERRECVFSRLPPSDVNSPPGLQFNFCCTCSSLPFLVLHLRLLLRRNANEDRMTIHQSTILCLKTW